MGRTTTTTTKTNPPAVTQPPQNVVNFVVFSFNFNLFLSNFISWFGFTHNTWQTCYNSRHPFDRQHNRETKRVSMPKKEREWKRATEKSFENKTPTRHVIYHLFFHHMLLDGSLSLLNSLSHSHTHNKQLISWVFVVNVLLKITVVIGNNVAVRREAMEMEHSI